MQLWRHDLDTRKIQCCREFSAGTACLGIEGRVWRLLRFHKHCQVWFKESRSCLVARGKPGQCPSTFSTEGASKLLEKQNRKLLLWPHHSGFPLFGFPNKDWIKLGVLIAYLILADFTCMHPGIYIFILVFFSPLVPQDIFDVLRVLWSIKHRFRNKE